MMFLAKVVHHYNYTSKPAPRHQHRVSSTALQQQHPRLKSSEVLRQSPPAFDLEPEEGGRRGSTE